MSNSCYTISEYSFQFLSLNALSLLSWTFLYSLIWASFECLVININRCMNLLNDNKPFTFNLISQPGRLRRVWISVSIALLYYGSMIDLKWRPSGSASSINLTSFLSIAGNEILLLLSRGGVPALPSTSFWFLPIIGWDAAPCLSMSWADNLSTSSGWREGTLLCWPTDSSSPNILLKLVGLSFDINPLFSLSLSSFPRSSKYF